MTKCSELPPFEREQNAHTGRQNSSNAGLTKVMYCARTLSKSRPRSVMSRSTEGKQGGGNIISKETEVV